MLNNSLSWILLGFILLETVVKTQLTIYESSHGFITNNHERYLVDDISMHEEYHSEVKSSTVNNFNLKYYLKFEPEFLDFKQRPLGIPHLEKVTLFNINSNRSIDMTSISGSTVHFHSSFFEDKKIPPLGNTSFNVVFLGREEGAVESNLFIQTTEGHIKYQVKGASIYSPYRLRPIVSIKLPLNTTFSPLIYMYNPNSEPVQIIEMYGSGGDFLLELPSGELEGPKDMWEIQPMETKAVIRIRFHAKIEQNHTAFVRIRLNNTEEILVVPLEVEVSSSSAGLFTPQGYVDFGVGGSFDIPKKVNLYLHNPLKKLVNINSITTTSSAITIEMTNNKISPGSRINDELTTVHVATLTLDWKTAFEQKDYSGKIIINYGKTKTEIPYYLTVVQGGIRYNTSSTRYYTNDKLNDVKLRDIVIKNDFLTPLKLINVSIANDGQEFFHLMNFKPVVLKVKEIQNVFTLRLKSKFNLANLNVNSHITLLTNITEFKFPLVSYNGKLKVYLPYKSQDNSLDLGLLSLDCKKEAFVLVVNNNPVNININNIKTSLPSAYVDIVGCNSGDYANVLLMDTYKNMTRCEILKTGTYAILRLTVKTSKTQGQIWGDVTVITQYEQLSIPIHFKVAPGKLEIAIEKVFEQCFPGKICSHPLKVQSTFNESMIIEDVFSIPPDKRLSSKHNGHIMARSNKIIGHLYLNPQLSCIKECYSGMLNETLLSWYRTLILPKKVHESDLNLVNMFYFRYLNITSNGLATWQNLTVRLDTSEVKGHIFKTRVKMTWPSLLADNAENKSIYIFPLTQVGNTTFINITIKNPSSHNLIVQMIMDIHYPNLNSLFEGLPPTFIPRQLDKIKSHEDRFFLHVDNKQKLNLFKSKLGIKAHQNSYPFILKPNENYTVTVGYKAGDSNSDSGFIFLRNNLTVIEVIALSGKGADPQFKFGNRKPGSSQPLAFELTDKHLKDCERDKNKKYPPPNLSVKRSFTARNTGSIVIYVNNFYINGLPCEGYGFKVLNCEPFILLPNGTKKIDIAFTPDFTLAKITRTLILATSLNLPVNYTLVTTVPSYYLSLCSGVLSRPQWEMYLYYSAISVMFFLLGFVIVIPVMESDRILKQTLGVMCKQSPTTQPTLDLRLVGTQTRFEIRSHKNDENDMKDKKKDNTKHNVDSKNGIRSINADDKNKIDMEKYTALIPTTSKSKRKLSKRNSNEHQTEEVQRHNKNIEVQKCPKIKSDCKVSDLKEAEIIQGTMKKTNKEIKTRSPVPDKKSNELSATKHVENSYEEETSSTTTESSNTEDIENKQPKIKKNKIAPTKTEAAKAEPSILTKNLIRKPIARNVPKIKETEPKEKEDNKIDNEAEPKYKNKKSSRKEKQHRKTNTKGNKQEVISMNQTSSSPGVHPTTPVPLKNVWGENRAKFSDVVARNDNSLTVNNVKPTSQLQICKPTLCVEPIVQCNTELGPIGTRKIDYRPDSNLPNLSTTNQCIHPLSSSRSDLHNNRSFYTECHKLAVESSNAFLDIGNVENWSNNNNSNSNNNNTFNDMPLTHNRHTVPSNNVTLPDPWTNSAIHTNPNNQWGDTLYQPNNNHNNNNNNEEVMRNRSNVQSNFLWGTSSVWTPWAPESRTTRTPPGFDFNRDVEEENRFQAASYNPFGNNNIWTQQPWNYGQQ